METTIETWLRDLTRTNPQQAALVTATRALFQTSAPAVTEKYIYGGLGFVVGDELIGGIFARKQHVTVELSCKHGLVDPTQCLEGTGPARRHLKLRTAQDLDAKQVAFFVNQVLAPYRPN